MVVIVVVSFATCCLIVDYPLKIGLFIGRGEWAIDGKCYKHTASLTLLRHCRFHTPGKSNANCYRTNWRRCNHRPVLICIMALYLSLSLSLFTDGNWLRWCIVTTSDCSVFPIALINHCTKTNRSDWFKTKASNQVATHLVNGNQNNQTLLAICSTHRLLRAPDFAIAQLSNTTAQWV